MKKFSKVLDGFGFGSDESAAGSPSATNTGSSQVSVIVVKVVWGVIGARYGRGRFGLTVPVVVVGV